MVRVADEHVDVIRGDREGERERVVLGLPGLLAVLVAAVADRGGKEPAHRLREANANHGYLLSEQRMSELPALAQADVVRGAIRLPRLGAVQLEEQIAVRTVLVRVGGHPEIRAST